MVKGRLSAFVGAVVVAAGFAAMAGCASRPSDALTLESAATATSAGVPSGLPSDATGRIPGDDRAVTVETADRAKRRVLAVLADGNIGSIQMDAEINDRELFVLFPLESGINYQLTTARLRVGSEPLCVGADGGQLRLVATACDISEPGQIVALAPAGADAAARPQFELLVGGHNVHIGEDGKVSIEERGDAESLTTFVLVDAGDAYPPSVE